MDVGVGGEGRGDMRETEVSMYGRSVKMAIDTRDSCEDGRITCEPKAVVQLSENKTRNSEWIAGQREFQSTRIKAYCPKSALAMTAFQRQEIIVGLRMVHGVAGLIPPTECIART